MGGYRKAVQAAVLETFVSLNPKRAAFRTCIDSNQEEEELPMRRRREGRGGTGWGYRKAVEAAILDRDGFLRHLRVRLG